MLVPVSNSFSSLGANLIVKHRPERHHVERNLIITYHWTPILSFTDPLPPPKKYCLELWNKGC